MTTRRYSSSGIKSRGPTPAEADFSVSTTQRDALVSAGSTTQRTDRDSTYSDETAATIDRVSDVTATEIVPGTFEQPPAFASTDAAVATVDADGGVTRVANGTVGIIVRTRLVSKRVDVTVERIGGTTSTFLNFVAGTLGRHCADAVDTRIASKTLATHGPLYSSQNHTSAVYVRNTSFWGSDLDLTPISPWNSSGAHLQAGTLVSPRHVVLAEHYPYGVGTTVRFVKSDNTVVTRTVAAAVDVGVANASDSYATDVRVCLLDSDVPAGIGFASVLPSNCAAYVPGVANGLPCLCLDQEEKGLVTELSILRDTAAVFRVPTTTATRQAFYETKISGDSGNPAFLIVNDALVLVATWTFGGPGGGPNYAALGTQINSAMTMLGGGYQLTTAVLSGFTAY